MSRAASSGLSFTAAPRARLARLAASLAVLLAALLSACATPPNGRSDLLDFLADGRTQREEVILRLGDPAAQYEGNRIQTWRLAKDDGGYFLAGGPRSDWSAAPYSLVLVFDASGVLERHSLVQVRPGK